MHTVLDIIHKKTQLIDLICFHLITYTTEKMYENKLVITVSSRLPMQTKNGLLTERNDLDTTQEEADIIIVQQPSNVCCMVVYDHGLLEVHAMIQTSLFC